MKLDFFKRIILDYRTYLLIGVIFVILAPVSEILHWSNRSIFFAEWAFFAFLVSTLKALLDIFLDVHPRFGRKIRSIKFSHKLWKH